MCTISLVYNENFPWEFCLTSNRDEAPGRETFSPEIHKINERQLLFPKDGLAGGTWIGISDHKRLLCIMNGGYKSHVSRPPYRLSRGIVVLDLLAADDFLQEFENYDLAGIEPFTLVACDWSNKLAFYEVVWDGNKKHLENLPLKNYIWSSSPLYSPEMKSLRESWFEKFQEEGIISPQRLWDFHHSAGMGNKEIDLVMDRGYVKTKSITQVIKTSAETKMIYEDLQQQKISETVFGINNG